MYACIYESVYVYVRACADAKACKHICELGGTGGREKDREGDRERERQPDRPTDQPTDPPIDR